MLTRQHRHGRALLAIIIVFLLIGGVLLFWYLVNSTDSGNNRTAPSLTTQIERGGKPSEATTTSPATQGNREEEINAINQLISRINAAYEKARNHKEGQSEGYMNEPCDPVGQLESENKTITASERIIVANKSKCFNHIAKFDGYYADLENLFVETGKIEQISARLAVLINNNAGVSPVAKSNNGFSWGFLGWVVAASFLLLLLFTSRIFTVQRNVVETISQGFDRVTGSLEQLRSTWSSPVRVEGVGGGQIAAFGQESGRSNTLPSTISSEVRQGFADLKESFKPILKSLDQNVNRLAGQSAPTGDATPAARKKPRPASSSSEHSSLPSPMLVSKYKDQFILVDSVTSGFQKGYLEKNSTGELSVLKDEQSGNFYLIPNDEWLQTPSYFHQKYAAYYEATNLGVGSIEVTSPAIVRPEGCQWYLERKGVLTTQKLS